MSGPDGGAGLRWGVEPMCAVLSEHGVPISPSTYYEWIAKTPAQRQLRDAERVAIITATRDNKKTGRPLRPYEPAATSSSQIHLPMGYGRPIAREDPHRR